MDSITKNPDLQKIAEAIFSNLTEEDDFLKCQEVNSFWKEILDRPMFWVKKLVVEKKITYESYVKWTKLIRQKKPRITEVVIIKKLYFDLCKYITPNQTAFICEKNWT